MRKLLYTTNSIESLNYQLRKVTKARGHFPADAAAVKLLWLASWQVVALCETPLGILNDPS